MAQKRTATIPKERISIVISREDKKHLGFIALEHDLGTPGEAVHHVLGYFDRTGKLKRSREVELEIPGHESVTGKALSEIIEV